ncbi:sugar ABC transporter permease [Clostridia bacterium]|nr:sugar ABC transporter permease [Clostridia bacterium]
MNNTKFKLKVFALCVPGLVGFAMFFIFPFGKSLWYAFINDVYHKQFAWFDNYLSVLGNSYFQLALKNTLVFSVVGVTLLLLVSLALSIGLAKLGNKSTLVKSAFVLPMLLPTVSVIFAWRAIFNNDLYFALMKDGGAFMQILPIYALYIWKNAGINIILLTAALTQVPQAVLEAAELDGARGVKLYAKVTIPLIAPTLFFVGVLSFVNSLKIFKESYLFYNTNYPPDAAYTIQYYMNNHFGKLNYQNLAVSSSIVAILLAIIIFIVYRAENRFTKDVF